jgi:hypothetical protein
MFPRPDSPLRTAFRRSLDAAIEFATLGEYGYAPAWEADDDIGPGEQLEPTFAWPARDCATGPQAATAPTATLLQPASAAGRARRNADRREAPICAGQPLRSRALTRQTPRKTRHRDGMAPRVEWCSTDAG